MSVMRLLQCVHCESEFDVSDLPEGKQYRCSICEQVLEIPNFSNRSEPLPKESTPAKSKKKTLLEQSLLEKPPAPPKKSAKEKKKSSSTPSTTTSTSPKNPPVGKTGQSPSLKNPPVEATKQSPQKTSANKPPVSEDVPKLNLKKEIDSKRKKTERLVKSEIRREISTQLIQKERNRSTAPKKSSSKSSQKKSPVLILTVLVVLIGSSLGVVQYLSSTKNSTSSKNDQTLLKTEKNELRQQFDATFEVHRNDPEKLFALAAWCKEQSLGDEQKHCYIRILELDSNHEGALIALGKKRTEELGVFDAIFGKGLFQQIEKNSLKVASDQLSTKELETIATSGEHFLKLFLKEFEAALNDKGYNAQNLPSFHLAVFSTQENYQAYCQKIEQTRASKEAGLLDTSKRVLVSYPKIETSYGAPPEKVSLQGNPGDILNTTIFHASYLEKDAIKMVVPKLNLVARQHLGDNYYAILKNNFFVAMQNSDSYVSKFAIQSFVDLLDLSYNWIFSRYQTLWDLKESDHLMGLYIFRSRKEFTEYAKLDENHGVLGFYRPWTQQMFTFRAIGDTEIENTVIHEGTHMIMHYFTGYRPPDQSKELFWFQEGIAEFFGSWARDKENGNIILEQLNQMRFRSLWSQAVSKSDDPKRTLLPLKRILSMSVVRAEIDSQSEKELKDKLYKQGWGLVHFFMFHDNGKYREKFHQYVKSYVHGNSGWPSFVKLFEIKSQKQLEEMEEEFREYIKSLKRKD